MILLPAIVLLLLWLLLCEYGMWCGVPWGSVSPYSSNPTTINPSLIPAYFCRYILFNNNRDTTIDTVTTIRLSAMAARLINCDPLHPYLPLSSPFKTRRYRVSFSSSCPVWWLSKLGGGVLLLLFIYIIGRA